MVLKINRSVTKQFVRVLGLRLTGRLHEPENVLSAHLAELLSHLHGFSVWVIHVAVGTRFFGFATFPAIGELLEVGQIGFGDSATLTDILNSGLLALDPSLDQLTVVVVAQLGNIFFRRAKFLRVGSAFTFLTSASPSEITKVHL